MSCEHAGCEGPATIRCRFGDGFVRQLGGPRRQSFVRYCDEHFVQVGELFELCDVALEHRPNGLLHPAAGARTLSPLRV